MQLADVAARYARVLGAGGDPATVVAADASELRDRLVVRARAARAVGVEGLHLDVDPATVVVRGSSAMATAVGGYRIRGGAAVESPFTVTLTALRTPSGWRLVDDRGARTLPLPWQLPGARRLDGRGVVVIGSAPAEQLAVVRDEAAAAWQAVTSLWPQRPDGAPVVLVPGSGAQFDELVRRGVGEPAVAAVTVGSLAAGRTSRGDVVVVNPAGMARLTPAGRSTILRHELIHLTIRGTQPGTVPRWLSEGFASEGSWPAGAVPEQLRARARTWSAAQRAPRDVPGDADLEDAASATRAYDQSALLVRDLVARQGRAAVVAFYRDVATGSTREAAATHHLGEPFTDVLDHWRASLAALR